MTPDAGRVLELTRGFFDHADWYQRAAEPVRENPLTLVAFDVLRSESPGLGRLLVAQGDRNFQLLVGWRPAAEVAVILRGRESALLGTAGDVIAYDALVDDALAIEVLAAATDGRQRARLVRSVSSLASHDALVFDEALFMKCYRVLEPGERPEVELVRRLDEVGFNAMLAPMGRWRAHGFDLALVREFLPSALEGRALALTSLRDLLARVAEPRPPEVVAATAGGDLAAELGRLGRTTATLHSALVTAFDSEPADPTSLAALVAAGAHPESAQTVARLAPAELGVKMRIHGDFHLRRVMRTEMGWVVAGFGDDPLYGLPRTSSTIPVRVGSPLDDLADLCFSLRLLAREASSARAPLDAERASTLAEAWEERNRKAFLAGYRDDRAIVSLVPGDAAVFDVLLDALVAQRARRYEAMPLED